MITVNLYLLRKKANIDLGETGEFNQRRIYDDQNTFDLLRVASEVLGEFTFGSCIGSLLWSRLGFYYYLSPDLWLNRWPSFSEEAKYRQMLVNALEIAVLFIFIYAFVEWFSSECDGELKAIARNHITWQCCLRIWTESIYKPRWPLKTSFNVVKKKIM